MSEKTKSGVGTKRFQSPTTNVDNVKIHRPLSDSQAEEAYDTMLNNEPSIHDTEPRNDVDYITISSPSSSSSQSSSSSTITRQKGNKLPTRVSKRDIAFVEETLIEVREITDTVTEQTKGRITTALEMVRHLQAEVCELYEKLNAEKQLMVVATKSNNENQSIREEINDIKLAIVNLSKVVMNSIGQPRLTTTIEECQPQAPPSPKTFSEIVKHAAASSKRENLSTVISIPGQDDAEKVRKSLVDKIVPVRQNIKIQNTAKLSNGNFLVTFKSPDSKKKFEEILEKDGQLKYDDENRYYPMLHLKGINSNYHIDEIAGLMAIYNPDISNYIKDNNLNVDKALNVRSMRPKRNRPELSNCIIRVIPEIRDILINQLDGRVNIEFQYIHIEDLNPLRQCFNCMGFNHIGVNCPVKNRPSCLHCGERHVFANCPNKNNPPSCINCRIAQMPGDHDHVAISRSCPVQLRRLKNNVKRVQYN